MRHAADRAESSRIKQENRELAVEARVAHQRNRPLGGLGAGGAAVAGIAAAAAEPAIRISTYGIGMTASYWLIERLV